NRTNLGLETPVPDALHDRGTGVGGFASLIYKATSADQIKLVGSLREDHYEIPNTPHGEAAGIDDHERERDAFLNVSWLRTIGSRAFLTVSPFYHYNRSSYDGGPNDPIVTTDRRSS